MKNSCLFGKVNYYQKYDNFTITETVYPPNSILEPHSHKNHLLSIVLSGSLTENYKLETFNDKSKSIIFKPANEIHSNIFHKQGAKCLNFELSEKWIENLKAYGLDLNKIINTNKLNNDSIITRLKNEYKLNDKYSKLIMEGLLIELFANIFRNEEIKDKDNRPDWLLKAITMIDTSENINISVKQVSDALNIHLITFIKTFKKHFNITPGEYINQKKLTAICNELLEGNKSLLDISYQFNFFDQSHFNKFFKKYLGVTPSEYKRLNKNSY